jgi:hypothetical protein
VPITKWNPDSVIQKALDEEEKRMGKAVLTVEREVKILLNKSGRGTPSAPGQPPHKQSGELQRSIHSEVKRDRTSVTGVIYSDSVKARRLELGFVGKDSAGRTIDQAPRPFLRTGLNNTRGKVAKILGSK